jgi:hypothetical protein
MRKLYLLLFLGLAITGFGQTYDVTIGYDNAPTEANKQELNNYQCWFSYGWGNCYNLDDLTATFTNTVTGKVYDSTDGYIYYNTHSSVIKYLVYKNIPIDIDHYGNPIFYDKTLKIKAKGNEIQDAGDYIELDEFICGGLNWTFDSFIGKIFVKDIHPNVGVFIPENRKADSNGPKTICAGEQLDIFATVAGFPHEIYNWQYSIDNNQNWQDVDEKYQVYNPNFTMQDILGSGHFNHFGKTIYLRMGNQCKAYSEEFALIYSACAPVAKYVFVKAPCSVDKLDIVVTFDRILNTSKNEVLRDFQIIKTNGQLTSNQISEVSIFDNLYPFQFTYSDVTGLEIGQTYAVRYQAYEGSINKGVFQSPYFTYLPPEPLRFYITTEEPNCIGGEGSIKIIATGGTFPYFYDNLNGETEIINGVTRVKKIPFNDQDEEQSSITIKNLSSTRPYNIKVTDSNDCIDTTAKD